MFPFRRKPNLPLIDEALGLCVDKEGRYVRATTKHHTALFACSDAAEFLRSVQQAVANVRLQSGVASLDGKTLEFSPQEYADLQLTIALHWARYCLSTG